MENADNNLNNEKREDLDNMPNGKRKQSFYPKSTNIPKNYPKKARKQIYNINPRKGSGGSVAGIVISLMLIFFGAFVLFSVFNPKILGLVFTPLIGLILIIIGVIFLLGSSR